MSAPAAPATNQRTILDVADIVEFLAIHGIVSGIQRVVIEVYKHLVNDDEVLPAFYSHDPRGFIELDHERFNHIVAKLSEGAPASEVRELAKALRRNRESQAPIHFTTGDVLLVLGAAWNMPGYFHEVAAAKRLGCRVVTLVYDLIPGVDESFPAPPREMFRVYLEQLARVSDRVPCISQATRTDFESYTQNNGLPTPPGGVTLLPGGLSSASPSQPSQAVAEPFILMVGTVEKRKNHMAVFRAWQLLRQRLDDSAIPKVVVVGRWGWNIRDFIDAMIDDPETAAFMEFRTDYVTDTELAELYQDCLFTLYPSLKEGWGLPVSESLDYGKAVITANISSLPEAGGQWATYVDAYSPTELADAAERLITDAGYRADVERNIIESRTTISWEHVAQVIAREVVAARGTEVDASWIQPRLAHEYSVSSFLQIDPGSSGGQYVKSLRNQRTMPMTGAITSAGDYAKATIICDVVHSLATTEGLRIQAAAGDSNITLEFVRPSGQPLTVYLGLVSNGAVALSATCDGRGLATHAGTSGPARIDLPAGSAGDRVTVRANARVRFGRRLTLTSFLLAETADAETRARVMKSFAGARAVLDKRSAPVTDREILVWIRSTRSWKLGGAFRVVYRRARAIANKVL